MQKSKDKLFLLVPNFADPAYGGQIFYCKDCALVEGVIGAFPELTKNLEIERIEWPRPRKKVVDLVGLENQSLPLLILAEGDTSKFQNGKFGNLAFVNDKDDILAALGERHGFPLPHP